MKETLTHTTAAIALALLGVVTLLWSWNTIAGLFEGPAIQAKHAIAVLLLLGVARTVLYRSEQPRLFRRIRGHEN